MAFWSGAWGTMKVLNSDTEGPPLENKRPGFRRLAIISLIVCALLAALLVELKTSWLQARLLAAAARRATYSVEPGPSPSVLYPASAPYTDRLGYSRLPVFLAGLNRAGYEVTAQARASSFSERLSKLGLFPIYREKPQAGLRILDWSGRPLFTSPHPGRAYARFEDIPPVVVQSLLFIENRAILDAGSPHQNPAVEWNRLAGAVLDLGISAVDRNHKVSGGSTLATQMEKIRYSPQGRTASIREKFRQMVSASLRAYQDGEDTVAARRSIVRDYINSLPLAASAGYGEVYGLGDGLWAWYGADFAATNEALRLGGQATPEQALAFRRTLSLLLAVNSPGESLISDPGSLSARTDSYLRLLAKAGIVSASLRDQALAARAGILRQAPPAEPVSFVERKGADAIRGNLASLLGLESNYTLDRLDLQVHATLDRAAQETVTGMLQQFHDPEVAAQNGLIGERLLDPDSAGAVIYSFTLYERGNGVNLLRVQTDSYDQPLSMNEGTKLELGSTAKLRTLANYLLVVRDLHEQFSGMSPEELDAERSAAADPITQWAADYLREAPDKSLPGMLQAAMGRTYSASPKESFYTGGGLHYFSNFQPEDNVRVLAVSEGLERSVNLVFVRLMRDIVRYYIARLPEASPEILQNPRDPARRIYLSRFADLEGREFLERFYRLHEGEDPAAALAALSKGRRVHPLEKWLLEYRVQHPQARLAEIQEAGAGKRQEVYAWLFSDRFRGDAQNNRIRIVLEREAFKEIHKVWKSLGFPFASLVPSYATAIGSSGDNPEALAELAGVILNGGVRYPAVRIEELHFAEGTPVDTTIGPKRKPGERVMPPEVAAVLRQEMFNVVEKGTARRAFGSVVLSDGRVIPVGGKTGTGDNRIQFVQSNGQRTGSKAMNRTATFVFIIGDRFYGTITAYVPGAEAGDYAFTSALPAQAFKALALAFRPLIEEAAEPQTIR
jgi:membrane peptidoglycan carboxypeptidase